MNTKLPRRRRLQPVTGLLLGVFSICSILLARTITVDDDGPAEFSRIQDAIDDSRTVAGDVVSVAPGIYFENLTLKCGVSVVGAGAASTTVDAGAAGPVARIGHCPPSPSRLEGLTLTNGTIGVQTGVGTPIITLNHITGNGLGVSLTYTEAIVSRNLINNNSAGGIALKTGGQVVIRRNVISGNRSSGISLYSFGSYYGPIISDNLITGNITTGAGGGIWASAFCGKIPSGALIVNNTIASNVAQVGGGLAIGGDVAASANVFYENRASVGGGGNLGGAHLLRCRCLHLIQHLFPQLSGIVLEQRRRLV